MENFKLPTEVIELPSKGLLYPEGTPLSKGELEIKYMTAKEEDILTNQNFINKGIVIDKLLKSLIVTEGVDYDQILIGDKNALLIASRILAYGKDYQIDYRGTKVVVDLTTLEPKEVDYDRYKKGINEFEFTLPTSKIALTFKILNHRDEVVIDQEVEGMKKINKDNNTESTTRLKRIITSVNGERDPKSVNGFIEKYLLARDSKALRDEYTKVSPDINMTFKYTDEDGNVEDARLPLTLNFFWPE